MNGVSPTSFRFGGLATGLDSQAIIDAILGAERIPILRLESQRARLQQQDSIFGKVRTKLDDLRNAIGALDTVAEFGSFKATSSNEQVATVSASGAASAGSFTIGVTALAQAETRITGGFADSNTTLVGSGNISITVGTQTVMLDLSDSINTLENVRDSINSAGLPVTASIINDGSATNPYKLVLASDETGLANSFSIDLSGFTTSSPNFNFSTILQTGRNANFTMNGVPITRPSNTVTDLLPGVTLNLLSEGTLTTPVTTNIVVTGDNDGTKKKVEDFIKAYNAIISDIAPQNVVNEEGQASGVLFGDSGLRSVTSRLRSALTAKANNAAFANPSVYETLASIGIRTDESGKLSLDSGKFATAASTDLQGVMRLFTDTEFGVAKNFRDAINQITDPVEGVIKARRDGISSRIKSINSRIDDLDSRLVKVEERLINRFAALETLVSNFQAQGSSLQSILRT